MHFFDNLWCTSTKKKNDFDLAIGTFIYRGIALSTSFIIVYSFSYSLYPQYTIFYQLIIVCFLPKLVDRYVECGLTKLHIVMSIRNFHTLFVVILLTRHLVELWNAASVITIVMLKLCVLSIWKSLLQMRLQKFSHGVLVKRQQNCSKYLPMNSMSCLR